MFVDIRSQNFPDTQTLKRVGWIAGCWSVGILCESKARSPASNPIKNLHPKIRFWMEGFGLVGFYLCRATPARLRHHRLRKSSAKSSGLVAKPESLQAARVPLSRQVWRLLSKSFCDESLSGFELFQIRGFSTEANLGPSVGGFFLCFVYGSANLG